jgi:hypothetical protein
MYMANKSATRRKAPAPATVSKAEPAAKVIPAKKAPAEKVTPARKATVAKVKPAKKAAASVTTKKQMSAARKQKTIRDSFNMPADDYALIGAMKRRAIALGREMKKSELLRAGLKALASMSEAALAQAIAAVAAIKTGRPVKKRK